MLLAVDIGNTNITLGVFEGERLRATWRLSTDVGKEADEYAVQIASLLELDGIDREQIHRAVLASVVPALSSVIETALHRRLGITPMRVGAGVKTGLRILYDDPRDVGPDRIVDAVAALKAHKPPIIVVDVGTATVFDAISREGDYLGGAIAPGIGVAADALAQKAALLRRVDLQPPKHAVGTNTTASLQSGILFGYAELIEGMIDRFKAEIGDDAWVIATGGWARLMGELTRAFDHIDPDLTLQGLRLVYEMNIGESS
ncbi:MAG TPA: type III pantothenate kinase [Dehalococcoidia bacterium]|nr:type III pantothenate kinase [Dehalococcoidia bacterium]